MNPSQYFIRQLSTDVHADDKAAIEKVFTPMSKVVQFLPPSMDLNKKTMRRANLRTGATVVSVRFNIGNRGLKEIDTAWKAECSKYGISHDQDAGGNDAAQMAAIAAIKPVKPAGEKKARTPRSKGSTTPTATPTVAAPAETPTAEQPAA